MQTDTPLPLLRPDIEVHPGPPAADGSPTYTVHDPLMRSFDKIGWAEAEVVKRLRRPTTLARLLDELDRETTVRASAEEVAEFCLEAVNRGLTTATLTRSPAELAAQYERGRINPIRWLLHHYLYFRVPLIRPDAMLARLLPYVRPLGSRAAFAVYAAVGLIGAAMCLERVEEYFSTFNYFFNFEGLLSFGLCVAAIKTVHEFSHAFAAKSLGLRVPVMGVAFMVLWPVAFCDVTDAWKIPSRGRRLRITAAGLVAELAIAGFAMVGWALTSKGLLHGVFFVISTTSILSTILVNVNPAMRFDGYFLLMDLWGIDNLQPRAFALTRWVLRKWLLGANVPSPEPRIRGTRQALVVAYTAYTWLYRLVLYLSIALLVYHKFTKALGIFLFGVEIGWFLIMPLWREASVWVRLHKLAGLNRRSAILIAVLLAVFLWAALPLQRRISLPAVLVAAQEQVIYTPYAGELADIAATRGAKVAKGTQLARLVSEKLDKEIAVLELERRIQQKRREAMLLSERDKALVPQQDEEIANITAKLASLTGQRDQSRLVAEQDGVMVDWDQDLRPGMPVAVRQGLGRLVDPDNLEVQAFVAEEQVADLEPGSKATFFFDSGQNPLHGTVAAINPVRAETIEHLALTSLAKGVFPVVKAGKGKLMMLESYFSVRIVLDPGQTGGRIGLTGSAWLTTKGRSYLADLVRRIARTFIREATF